MQNNWIHIEKDDFHIMREKRKAQQMKKTSWWKSRVSQGICHYCGNKFEPVDLTIDHIVPLSRGGSSTKGNMVCCCKACNSTKKYKTPVEMLLEV